MGPQRAIILIFLLTSLVIMTSVRGEDQGVFCGGTISFHFVDTSNPDMYTAKVTAITGWVLGKGPCGPSCSESDVGRSTKQSRSEVIQSVADPEVFGTWSKEFDSDIRSYHTNLTLQPITGSVNQQIQGRVAAVSRVMQFEQEIAHFYVNISTAYKYTDLSLSGTMWKDFDLNPSTTRKDSNIQTKVRPLIRNDTGKPNSSPVVLNTPIYRIKLNEVTKIYLTPSDGDGDRIKCRLAEMIEIDGASQIDKVTVSDDCVVTVPAMENNGFHDDGWGMVGVAVEDTNRHPIQLQGALRPAYYPDPLSISVVDFMIWVTENLTVPEFVSPTPQSQHLFTVYAGSSLSIPLAARPFNEDSKDIGRFNLLSLPDHALPHPEHPTSDPARASERVMTSSLDWRSTERDTGDFLIRAVAVDEEGLESMERSYKIFVKNLEVEAGTKTNDGDPYFPYFPKPGSIRCLQNATCSLPIFAKPGTTGRNISSIAINRTKTEIPDVMNGTVKEVTYKGTPMYRADVTFTARDLGQKRVCFRATDNHGRTREQCLQVELFPPNPCDALPCPVSATCLANGTDFTCLCPPLRTGPLCGKYIDACDPNPCTHEGDCHSRNGLYTCICKPGYKAVIAHSPCVEINECESRPCQHEGTCEDKLDDFQCHCVNGFTGKTCENASLPDAPCAMKNCSADSLCVESDDNATCLCPLGLGADHCDQLTPDVPVLPPGNSMEPHMVAPSLLPGSEILCPLGETCPVPLYLMVPQGALPVVVRGTTSPQLQTSLSPLNSTDNSTALPDTVTSVMSVTSHTPGRHTACVEVLSSSGSTTEELCYSINTPDPTSTTATPVVPTIQEPQFTAPTPPGGSIINCPKTDPCHVITHTTMPPSGQCEAATPISAGAYSFGSRQVDEGCATDILLTPNTSAPISNICLVAGNAGEKRCFQVNTVDNSGQSSDPCLPDPCHPNGVCMPDTSTNHYTCVCHVPFKGEHCSQKDSCASGRCEHQAVCEDQGQGAGFTCTCQPGYTADNCRHENPSCEDKSCENGALCVISRQGHPVCKCPLGKGGSGGTCHKEELQGVFGPVTDPNKPDAAVPSAGHGSTILCYVGHTCPIPVFVTSGHSNNLPKVTIGPTSTELHADVTPPHSFGPLPGTMTSTLRVTPRQAGHLHVCVAIRTDPSSDVVGNICYNVNSSNPDSGSIASPTSAPSSNTGGGIFTGTTPPKDSELRCRLGTPCHVTVQTQKPVSGTCEDVRTQTVGVYTFPLPDVDGATCSADVLIDPDIMAPGKACLRAGLSGETRCYPVVTTDPQTDPCSQADNPCFNGGVCIPDSSVVDDAFTCACHIPFTGHLCNDSPTSDATTSISDLTTPTSDLLSTTSDLTTPTSAILSATSDDTTITSDVTTPTSTILSTTSDVTTPTSALLSATSDDTTPTSDLLSTTSDVTTPTSDLLSTTNNVTTPTSALLSATSDDTTITSALLSASSDDTTITIDDTTVATALKTDDVTTELAVKVTERDQCAAEKEAFKRAAAEDRVWCTCVNPVTNRTYIAVQPRVSNWRLLGVGGAAAGVSTSLLILVALGYHLLSRVKAKAVSCRPAPRPPGNRKGAAAWPDKASTGRRFPPLAR